MNTHTGKAQQSKRKSATSGTGPKQNQGDAPVQLIDNRSQTIAHRQLQKMTENSHQVKQLSVFQEMADSRVIHPTHASRSNQDESVTQRKIVLSNDPGKGVYDSTNSVELAGVVNTNKKGYPSAKRPVGSLVNSHNSYIFNTVFDLLSYMTEDAEDKSHYTEELGLQPEDMTVTGEMPTKYEVGKGCVVQSIAQIESKRNAEGWHDYFIGKEVDYSEAMNHIAVFGDEEVGLKLIHNENNTWAELDEKLAEGKQYVFINMDGPGKDGHAFAVTKNGKGNYTIHDTPQNIIKKYEPGLKVQYVFGK